MFYVESLSTKPEQQGHGFASALVGTVLDMVCRLFCSLKIILKFAL